MRSFSKRIALGTLAAVLAMPSCMCRRPAKEQTIAQTTDFIRTTDVPAHARGMWVWGMKARLADSDGAASLLETCRAARLTEVYLAVSNDVLGDPKLPAFVSALDKAGVRVEALMGEAVWYRPTERAAMLASIDAVVAFNARNASKFKAIHFDIEPHQLPENKGNHAFLPALAETLREARARAASHGMSTSADLPRFAFDEQGRLFGSAVDRPFLMLYELPDRRSPRVVALSRNVIDGAYAGLAPEVRGRIVVGLRIEDFPDDIDAMTKALDAAHGGADGYGGWAVHDEAKYRARFSPPRKSAKAATDKASCP